MLFSMCIDAPGSSTNSLSSGFFEDGADNDQTSEGEKNVALSFFIELVYIFSPNPTLLCGRIVLVARFLPVFDPQILPHKDCALEVHTSVKSTSISSALHPGIRNPYVLTPSMRLLILFPLLFFYFLLGCLPTSVCLNRHLSPNSHSDSVLYFKHPGGCQKKTSP